MSILSVPIPHGEGSVAEQASPMVAEKVLTANEVSGYRASMALEDAIRKCLAPISENARDRIRMSLELSVYSNSKFAYAIFLIAISLFRGKGGREIGESKPLPMIFAILTHCLNKTAIRNYSVSAKSQWFCQDTMLLGSSPLAQLEDFRKFKDGHNPRLEGGVVPGKVLPFFFCMGLGDFAVRKDVLVGDGRAR